MTEKTLLGKTALITGASRGIGRDIALRYAREGADIIAVARNQNELASLGEEIKAFDVRYLAIPANLRKQSEFEAIVQKSLAEFGRIDFLVNNAGVGFWAPIQEIRAEQYDEMFDVNMKAVFLLTQACLPQMIERKSGHIINIASTSSRWAYPEGTIYCASKFAVLGFNEALAKELRTTGVRVTAICPGQVNTYLGGAGPEDWQEGMLNGEDIAALAVQAVTLPPHAIMTEMVVWPRAEQF